MAARYATADRRRTPRWSTRSGGSSAPSCTDCTSGYACATYLEGKQRLRLPEARIPQLAEVNELLGPLTGFQYVPAAGLVDLLEFYGSLADGIFHSTQYVRHHSVPLYTPEPDVLHEVFGHGNCLAHDRFAALYRAAGEAVRRVQTAEALEFVSKVFWFSLEFGVVREGGEVRCYGAGLLSSYGEIQQVAQADLRPLDIARMGVQTYDITHYQPHPVLRRGFRRDRGRRRHLLRRGGRRSVQRLTARRLRPRLTPSPSLRLVSVRACYSQLRR